jgi:hypothetical protein
VVVKGQKPATVAPATPMARPPQRIRVGGNVQATKLVRMARPEYPALHLEAISSDVDARLVTAALDAVRQWKYQLRQ